MARITAENEGDDSLDELAFDDTAFAVGQPVNAGRVLVASPGNFFLEQVLASLPGITAYRALAQASPDGSGEQQFHLPDESFDLYIFDGVLPTSGITGIPLLPDGNLLIINPPSNPLFQVTGTFTNTQLIYQSDDELMQYIDWKGVQIARAHHVQLPPWGKRLVDSEGGPLLFAGETGGRRIAVLTFDLHESDLPLHVTFPILFANLIHYLAPPQSFDVPEGLQPGEALNILPQPGVDQVLVVTPSEKAFVLQPGTGSLVFSETGELGVYAINYLYENTESYDLVAVNLFDAGESNIKPVENIQVGLTNVSPTAEEKFGRFEIWRPVALLALLVLIIEWWVYHRQHSLPSPNLIKSVYGRIRNLRPG
jgi:Ca-activated chloride channel family protein